MADGTNLLRSEAVEGSRNRIGSPVSNTGTASWIIASFMVSAFAAVVIFLALAQFSRKETVVGQVVPAEGVVRVASLRAGTVKSLIGASDVLVTKGQPLFSLSYDPVLEGGVGLADGINKANDEQIFLNDRQGDNKEQQIIQSQLELKAKLAGQRATIVQLQGQRELQDARIDLLQKNLGAIRPLQEKHIVAELEVREREDALLQAKQSRLQLEQNIEEAENLIPQLIAQLNGLQQSLEETGVATRASRSQLEARRLTDLAQQSGDIVAQITGRLTSVTVKPGDLVSPNRTLALIVPESTKHVQQVNLWVPSRSVGFVSRGDQVRLMFDAFPFQTFGVGKGRVREISMAPILPSDVPVPIDAKEQVYRVVVELDSDTLPAYGRLWPLTPGMRLSADLVLEKKSLLSWMFDPLNAVRRRAE